jgi:VWFA-related protein
MRDLKPTLGVVLVASLVLSAPLYGQRGSTDIPQTAIDAKPDPMKMAEEQEHTIKVRVNEVIVPVTVLNSKGEMIFDLKKDNFHIYDDGVEQTIEQFDLGGDSLAVALVLETSSHIQMMAPTIRRMGSVFTETVMALEGRAAVITYGSTVDVRQPFTQDHDAIERSISKVEFNASEMRLYDAMSTAVGLLKMEPPNFRRVILIVGESQDQSSDSKLGLVLREVQLANISIYAVGPSSTAADLRYGTNGTSTVPFPKSLPAHTEAPPRSPSRDARFDVLTPAIWLLTRGTNEIKNHQLEVAAASTGGVHYRVFSDSTVQSAIDKIGGEIHAQYILSYTPNAGVSPGFHKINVTVMRPKAIVRTRPGYFIESLRDSSQDAAYTPIIII